jgi:hypothetical protein
MKLVVYRDCNGITLGATPIEFRCLNSNPIITSLTIPVGTPVDVTPLKNSSCSRCQSLSCAYPYGIHKYTMSGIVNLNSSGNCCMLQLSWQDGGRNAATTNLSNPGNNLYYTEALLNRCQSPCDNSPQITNIHDGILCVGVDYNFQSGAIDYDTTSTGGKLDSIRYEWGYLMNSHADTIDNIPNYSYNKPFYFWGFPNESLPFPRGIHLDSITGELRFRPMKPEISAIAIKVREFRNGILIGEVTRDIQLIMITCPISDVEKQISQNDFKIYPNPASDYVNIVYQGLSKWEGNLNVFDPNLKLVMSRQLYFDQPKTLYQLPLTGYLPGVYLLKFENSAGSMLQKIVIQ